MGRKNGLDVDHISLLRAIIKRGHLYKGPRQLGLLMNLGTSPDTTLKINVESSLRFLKLNFNFIDKNGDLPKIKDATDFQRNFLKEVKGKFLTFQELECQVKEFLNKREA